jgi:NADH-quinone oxidoreductase subunit L
MDLITICFVILLLPLLAFAIQMAIGSRLPDHGWYVPTAAILISLLLSIWIFLGNVLPAGDPNWSHSLQWDFINIGDLSIKLGIMLDPISSIMLIVVTVVSSLVHIYSTGYMADDPGKSRFFGYLGIFSFSMIWLVLSDNLLGIFMGWELVGLSSYLLIGFWFEKDAPPQAGKKAFIANRVGDLGFIAALMIVMWMFGTFNLHELQGLYQSLGTDGVPEGNAIWLTLIGLGLFGGAIGKSAQFPLHVWLPDAMEGPTPVSALIHAATMVAAGVYLMVRVFFMLTFDASLVVAYIGGFTSLMAATIAVAQYDIKKVLAYSTVSQLGYMIMAIGVGAYSAGFLHLMTHAFFKACLFLGSGSVIHAMHHVYHEVHDHSRDAQDMRNMGGLRKFMPVTYITFLIATLSLSGVPLFSGFVSKDAILAGSLAFGMQHPQHYLLAIFGFGAAALTAFYMFRLVFMTFHGKYLGKEGEEEHLHENKLNITGPLIVLATLSVFIIYTPNPTDASKGWFYKLAPQPEQPVYAIGLEDAGQHHSLLDRNENLLLASVAGGYGDSHEHEAESHNTDEHAHSTEDHALNSHDSHGGHDDIHHKAHNMAMIISILIAISAIGAAWLTYMKKSISAEKVAKALPGLHNFLQNKWFFDELYDATVIKVTMVIAYMSAWFDRTIVDGIVNGAANVNRVNGDFVGFFDKLVVDGAVNAVAVIVHRVSDWFRGLQRGDIQGYLMAALLAVIAIFVIQVL